MAEDNPVASKFIVPVYCIRLQIKRNHHRAFGPASGNLVLNGIVEATGRSLSGRTWGKWIRYRRAYVRI